MTSNDPGHVNNLDRTQRETLRKFWISLLAEINTDPSKVVETPMGDELFFMIALENPDSVLLRWLRARKWNVQAAVQHMMETLKWRQEWGVRKLLEKGEDALHPDERSSAKLYTMGKDKAGRCISYVHANEHIKGQYQLESTEKMIILFMETARYLVNPPVEDGTVIIDMGHVTFQNLDYQHIKFMINAMQNCYPECLGLGIVVNAPWTFNVVWNVIRPWLDPVVASKIHFVRHQADLVQHIDPSSIPIRLGGTHIDYRYRPATKDDNAMIETIRQDTDGMAQAKLQHQQASKEFLDATIRWAKAPVDSDKNENSTRMRAMEQLALAFRELFPYVWTRTHYHRTGEINEPMFNTVYDRIRNSESETTHF